MESLAFRGAFVEAVINLKGYHITTTYSLEKEPISTGSRVRVRVYRLYAFEGGAARLVENCLLESHGNGYNFVI